MGNYYIPASYFFKHAFNVNVLKSPKITSKTIELGSKNSPDFVCAPFKYTLGTMIEGLEKGADVLLQMGGGCRYGYYSELQEKILKDLGYEFTLINFVTAGKMDIKNIYKELKKINKKLNIIKILYYLFISTKMIKYMDNIDKYIRKNIGFEVVKGEFESLNEKMLKDFSKVKNFISLRHTYKKYLKKFKQIKTNKKNVIRVGIVGELYTVLQYQDQKEIADVFGVSIDCMVDYLPIVANYRNLCAHEDICYINRTQKAIDDTKYHRLLYIPKISEEYIYGKNDLFALIIILKQLLEENNFNLFINEISYELDRLSGKLKVIKIEKVLNQMGFPNNYKEIVRLEK